MGKRDTVVPRCMSVGGDCTIPGKASHISAAAGQAACYLDDDFLPVTRAISMLAPFVLAISVRATQLTA